MRECTPWKPSLRAINRIQNPLPTPACCPLCGGDVIIGHLDALYKNNDTNKWPWIYICTQDSCSAYIGMHRYTNIPYGVLADEDTRNARRKARELFDSIWRNKWATTEEGYAWLATRMNITMDKCHFAMFDIEKALKAYTILSKEYKKLTQPSYLDSQPGKTKELEPA